MCVQVYVVVHLMYFAFIGRRLNLNWKKWTVLLYSCMRIIVHMIIWMHAHVGTLTCMETFNLMLSFTHTRSEHNHLCIHSFESQWHA